MVEGEEVEILDSAVAYWSIFPWELTMPGEQPWEGGLYLSPIDTSN